VSDRNRSTEQGRWQVYTVCVLSLLLLMQISWFVGTTTLNDFERLQKERVQLREQISRIKAAGSTVGGEPTSSVISLIEPLTKQMDEIAPQMQSALDGLRIWNRSWRWVIFWSTHGESGGSANNNAEVRSARGATMVLGLYVLPLMYGWLGALLWVVQKFREDDSEQAVRRIKPGSRVVTGVVAGPMIGMFLSPEFLNSLAFQATPFLVAFLGGYSTDIFFALIDRLMRGLRDALDSKSRADERTNSGQARGGDGARA